MFFPEYIYNVTIKNSNVGRSINGIKFLENFRENGRFTEGRKFADGT